MRVMTARNAHDCLRATSTGPSEPARSRPMATYQETGVQTLPPSNAEVFKLIHGREPNHDDIERRMGLAALGRYVKGQDNPHDLIYGEAKGILSPESPVSYESSGFQTMEAVAGNLALVRAKAKAAVTANRLRATMEEEGLRLWAESKDNRIVHSEQHPFEVKFDGDGNSGGREFQGLYMPNVFAEDITEPIRVVDLSTPDRAPSPEDEVVPAPSFSGACQSNFPYQINVDDFRVLLSFDETTVAAAATAATAAATTTTSTATAHKRKTCVEHPLSPSPPPPSSPLSPSPHPPSSLSPPPHLTSTPSPHPPIPGNPEDRVRPAKIPATRRRQPREEIQRFVPRGRREQEARAKEHSQQPTAEEATPMDDVQDNPQMVTSPAARRLIQPTPRRRTARPDMARYIPRGRRQAEHQDNPSFDTGDDEDNDNAHDNAPKRLRR